MYLLTQWKVKPKSITYFMTWDNLLSSQSQMKRLFFTKKPPLPLSQFQVMILPKGDWQFRTLLP